MSEFSPAVDIPTLASTHHDNPTRCNGPWRFGSGTDPEDELEDNKSDTKILQGHTRVRQRLLKLMDKVQYNIHIRPEVRGICVSKLIFLRQWATKCISPSMKYDLILDMAEIYWWRMVSSEWPKWGWRVSRGSKILFRAFAVNWHFVFSFSRPYIHLRSQDCTVSVEWLWCSSDPSLLVDLRKFIWCVYNHIFIWHALSTNNGVNVSWTLDNKSMITFSSGTHS